MLARNICFFTLFRIVKTDMTYVNLHFNFYLHNAYTLS